MATPLGVAASSSGSAENALAEAGYSMSNLISGVIPGSIGSTSVIAILIGLGFLMITGIASSRMASAGLWRRSDGRTTECITYR